MESGSCSSPSRHPPPIPQSTTPAEDGGEEGNRGQGGGQSIEYTRATKVSRPLRKRKGILSLNSNQVLKDGSSSCSSSTSSSSPLQRVRIRGRRSGNEPRLSRNEDGVSDLALPLGMSFAAIIVQVLDVKNISGGRIPVDHLSTICTSALKESITYIYGNRFDSFMRNFEKSFGSTLKALRSINETSSNNQGDTASCSFRSSNQEAEEISGIQEPEEISGIQEPFSSMENFQNNLPLNCINNQLVIHRGLNQDLANVSERGISSGFNQSILSTFEKSVMEQSRSNDLKTVEISLIMKRLQLKQSQLALSSYANLLEKVKLSMGFSKASFKEEKLRNQMQDARLAQLLRRCIDLLVTGLIIMCGFLVYGACTFSYQRIMEATSSCTSVPKESKSWWVPKPVASFSSGWLLLRCHAVILTRLSFGLLMILAVAYSVFQRSATSGPTMPVTFILLLLGAVCGVAGKLCVDTLGGNGYCWLIYWETLCLLHFLANVFPSILYHILYGPVFVTQVAEVVRLPYWIRRYTFYTFMLLILPSLTGLLPFGSIEDWKGHFSQKNFFWSLSNEHLV
ncbi:hypothetical protein J5N97_009243 [Dioscorea zingiberensis]|uniref:Protein CPR-5 n=1 Tax=Dioscorea zingiberensis TaxID=325984 RepID=A0A9D5HLL6_9LILI|nr:hypothetical protein J5N97_009243 [Dioscorea zingiberensis]